MSIDHRDPRRTISRAIYVGSNGGEGLKTERSQDRAGFETHSEWSIIDTYLEHMRTDPIGETEREDFPKLCGVSTVLSDFWKY